MSAVKILSFFEATRSEKAESKWTNSEGVTRTFEARSAGTYQAALVETIDGTFCRVNIEVPKLPMKVDIGDILHIDCPQMEDLEKILMVRNVSRHVKASK